MNSKLIDMITKKKKQLVHKYKSFKNQLYVLVNERNHVYRNCLVRKFNIESLKNISTSTYKTRILYVDAIVDETQTSVNRQEIANSMNLLYSMVAEGLHSKNSEQQNKTQKSNISEAYR